jgi:uncharacterized membrane protein YsdA (DUF1294 family)
LGKLCASHRGAQAHGCAISHFVGKKFAQMIQLHHKTNKPPFEETAVFEIVVYAVKNT